jgi:hypothetical protein
MKSTLKVFLLAATAVGVMMFGATGVASATCSPDSSSGPDANARTGTPITVPLVGQGWLGAGAGGVNGEAERTGFGYAEGVTQVGGGGAAAAGEAHNDSATVGYFDGDASVSGTTVTTNGDGSTLNGAVTGSAEINSGGSPPVNDVEVAGECLTPN